MSTSLVLKSAVLLVYCISVANTSLLHVSAVFCCECVTLLLLPLSRKHRAALPRPLLPSSSTPVGGPSPPPSPTEQGGYWTGDTGKYRTKSHTIVALLHHRRHWQSGSCTNEWPLQCRHHQRDLTPASAPIRVEPGAGANHPQPPALLVV